MGAWGPFEKGWHLAYTVAIARSLVQATDSAKPAWMAWRVTHIFRRDAGEWKLVHRHADPPIRKMAPPAVPI